MTCHRTISPNHIVYVFRILSLALCSLIYFSACSLLPTPIPAATPALTQVPPSETPSPSQTSTKAPTQTPYIITATTDTSPTISSPRGTFFLSLADAGYYHLFTLSPQSLSLTRITSDSWNDITPALSPDGKFLAFASNQNSYWDLFLLDLSTGKTIRLTDTPEYDSAPSWSPDGAFLTYESFQSGNMDVLVRSVRDPAQVYNLTQDISTDISPVWSPRGRQIAFISNRSGDPEVWIADLDRSGDDRFYNISHSPQSVESHPAWSPDGNYLAWASTDLVSGLTGIYVWDEQNPEKPANRIGSGDWPIWEDNNVIATILNEPNQTFLTGFTLNSTINIPPLLLPDPCNGLMFGNSSEALPGPSLAPTQSTPTPSLTPFITPLPSSIVGRSPLISLAGVKAPFPQLHENAFASFEALRSQVARDIGWDALANLENAYVPLTTPLEPGLGDDWLYTGRAFTINPALIQAGWMVMIREDFGEQTYWRIYLRTTAQDGSMGAPLTQNPWNFNARTQDPQSYENGGQLATTIPSGYWFDLTALAIQYGWERLPALTDWRTYYAGARFNELAFTQGLDWREAMLQLYPPEILETPTIVVPPTRTPTPTSLWYKSPTPTTTATPRPTNTP